MMSYLRLLRTKADPNFKSICANIPEKGILAVFKLAKADSSSFFELITDQADNIYDENYAEFNFSSVGFFQKFSEIFKDKPPDSSLVRTLKFFDDLSLDDNIKEKL